MEKYLVKTVNNIEADASGNVDGNSLGFIPLSGTEVGNPVTGNIELSDYLSLDFKSSVDNKVAKLLSEEGNIGFITYDNNVYKGNINTIINNDNYELYLSTDGTLSKGFYADKYYGANYTDNTYTQKKYVDEKAPSAFGQATLTAGSVTVSDTNITNTSIIICTANGILDSGFVSVTKNPGVGFTIQSSNVLDARTVDYIIKY